MTVDRTSRPMLRVVLDINVLISAYFFSKPDTPPHQIDTAALDKRFRLLVSIDYRSDLIEAFSKPKFAERLLRAGTSVAEIADTITRLAEGVGPQFIPPDAVRDKDDVVILSCAVSGQADYIVSGDKDLITLESYARIPILTPSQFLDILNPPPAPSPTSEHETNPSD
jgi:uncharacterized protein